MKDKPLKSMDKIQLLSIMRQQELEIQKLSVERDELLTKHQFEIEKLNAEKNELARNQGSGSIGENSELLMKYQVEFEKLIDEKNELAKKFHERDIEIRRLTAEKEEFLKSRQFEIERLERLIAEKDEFLKSRQNEIERLEKLIAEKDETRRVNFENIEKAGSLAEAAVAASGIITSAQEAADIYLNNIKRLETTKVIAAKKIEDEARIKADAMIKIAEKKREEVEREEKKSIENLKNASDQYMDLVAKAQLALNEMTQQYNKINSAAMINAQTAAEQTQQSQAKDEMSFRTGSNVKYEYIGNIGKYKPASHS